MSHIKTREKVEGIRAIEKGAVASERMRSAFIRTKQDASALVDSNSSSSDEYSADSAQHFEENTVRDAGELTVRGSRAVLRNGRKAIESRQSNSKFKAETASASEKAQAGANVQQRTGYTQGRQNAEFNTSERPQVALSQNQVFSHHEHTIKTVDSSTRTIKQTAKSTGRATIKTAEDASRSAQRSIKTAEESSKVAVKTTQAGVKAAQKAAAGSAKAAKKSVQAAKATGKAASTAVKAPAKAVAATAKAIAAATKALITAIASGGWVAVIIIVIVVLLAAVIGSPFGILFSGENATTDSVPASVAIAQINYEYNMRLEELQSGGYDGVVIAGEPAEWTDVLAAFAVKVAGAEDDSATYVATFDEERVQKLRDVFNDMTTVTTYVETIHHSDGEGGGWTERILHITITGKTAIEAAESYDFSEKQNQMLRELLDRRDMLSELVGETMGIPIEASELLKVLPEDLSPERSEVLKTACSLVGKVNYFWGGKSSAIGWDSRWGTMQCVTSPGSLTTGTTRPFGLDCSGFVDWAFNNALGCVIGKGGGTVSQYANSTKISWSEALPGDIVFNSDLSHVGIYAGVNETGAIQIIHCSSSANNVVITDIQKFTRIVRPKVLE